ncbi:protein of unknown function [Nitrosotalea devaniterrae]|uniref:Uncharacterized protein n=1 Tax=Nitrosotalea devaniterrae TaxID=1078905 RepID=A0A128A372_9ARCH|nr:protein of unknown function [Candidatus Nitrosotalea devanaterra]
MTLLIFASCSDGFVIVSDRKQTYDLNLGAEFTKCLLSGNGDFFIALSGINNLPKVLLDRLNSNSINSQNIELEIKSIIDNYFNVESHNIAVDSSIHGFLVVKTDGVYKLKEIEAIGQVPTFSENDYVPVIYIGDMKAQLFAKHFLQNINLREMACEDASKYIVATMMEVSKSIKTISDETLGYDIVRFLNSGTISRRMRFTDSDIASLDIKFDINSDKKVFSDSEEVGTS